MQVTAQQIRTWLADVPDPEIPVISLVELGVIRDVRQVDAQWEVDVSPTYSGCPATSVIAQTIREAHRLVETGAARGKIVIAGFETASDAGAAAVTSLAAGVRSPAVGFTEGGR